SVSIEIAWNKDTMETLYIVHEPEITDFEKEEIKLISKNMEQIVRSSKNLPVDFSTKDIEAIIDSYMKSKRTKIPKNSIDKYKYFIQRDYEGFGPIDPIIRDPYVEDISCNGIGIPIFIEHKRHGALRTNILFPTKLFLDSYVIRLAQLCGKEISMNDPIMDGTFPQGHRI
ncbi:type II secretion system protein E, partial [mine drainage metagenome]